VSVRCGPFDLGELISSNGTWGPPSFRVRRDPAETGICTISRPLAHLMWYGLDHEASEGGIRPSGIGFIQVSLNKS
jgi:hypothetical protein